MLISGVDVWLNNPLPPFEASGTSGMKAVLNGVLRVFPVTEKTQGQVVDPSLPQPYKLFECLFLPCEKLCRHIKN
jgi:hypothetical protein